MRPPQLLTSMSRLMIVLLVLALVIPSGVNPRGASPVPAPTIAPAYDGFLDWVDCSTVFGWAWDMNNNSSRLNVTVYDGSTVIASGTADQFRQDLLNAGKGDGAHGFAIPTPASIRDGQSHSITVKVTNTSFSLGGTPRVFNSTSGGCTAPPPPAYEGFHEAVDCNYVTGWVWDMNNNSTRVNVTVYDGSTMIASGTADQFRQDLVNAGKGDGAHGFAILTPARLKDGQTHSVRVKITDTDFNLGFTPLSFNSTNAGCTLPPAPSTDPAVSGKWETQANGTPVDNSWPIPPIHINLLPNGKLLFWARDKSADGQGYDIQGYTTARVWDPFYKSFDVADNGRTNLFCAGHSFLPDGRLLVAGGHNIYSGNLLAEGMGSINTNIYDWKTNSWAPGPDMNNGRWYPYNVTLANGETLIVSGTYFGGIRENGSVSTPPNTVAQIFDAQGNLRNVTDTRSVNIPQLDNFPLLHLLPDGRVLAAASRAKEFGYILRTSPVNGAGDWLAGPSLRHAHDVTTSVQYRKDKVLIVGGRELSNALNVAEVFDLNSDPIGSTTPAPMYYSRMHHTGTLLPDGKVLVTGGTSCGGANELNCGPGNSYGGAANNPELWNPQTETWTIMQPHQEARVYHSTAILLPDGRVLVGGGGLPGATGEYPANDEVARRKYSHKSVEIFLPPYFYLPGGALAPRPVITSAPKEVTYGQNFTVGVGTLTAQEIAGAVLIRLGAVTHGFNQDQRRVPLNITARSADGRSLNLSAPVDGIDCPPGYYMLFLLKQNGANLTPSVAKIVRVNKVSTPPAIQVIQGRGEFRSLSVTATSGTSWNASVTSGNGFISISGGGTVTGSATISYYVSANTTGARRSGSITISVPGQPAFNQVINIYQGKMFDDIPSSWAEDTPSKLNALGITSGCSATGFCPDNPIRRDELSVLFVRAALGVETNPPATTKVSFPNDVPLGYWAHDYIEDFYKRGYTGGCSAGSFCPGGYVSRAQLAVFLVASLGINPPATTRQTYVDVPTTHWAHRFIEEAAARGLLSPCVNANSYCPEENATRGFVATGLTKAYGY